MKHGNMTCYPSGRKKSYNAWSTKKKKEERKDSVLPASTNFVRDTLSREERLKISSGYTVAPAYNKGAYQVIPRDQVENIGK